MYLFRWLSNSQKWGITHRGGVLDNFQFWDIGIEREMIGLMVRNHIQKERVAVLVWNSLMSYHMACVIVQVAELAFRISWADYLRGVKMSKIYMALAVGGMLLISSKMAYCLDDVDKAVCDAYPSPEERRECYRELGVEAKPQGQQRKAARPPESSRPSKSTRKYELPADIQQKERQHGINSAELNRLYAKHIREWSSFTSREKNITAKGSIILMRMETADDPDVFRKHTSAAIQCMDSRGHGMNMRAKGADVMVGIAECSAKTYRTYCTICED
jgi:hypothetical protein